MDTHTEHLIGPVVVTRIGVSLARLLPRVAYVVKTMVRIPEASLNFRLELLMSCTYHFHTKPPLAVAAGAADSFHRRCSAAGGRY